MVPFTSALFFSFIYEVLLFALLIKSSLFIPYEDIDGMTVIENE
jgi:hypothetical protein